MSVRGVGRGVAAVAAVAVCAAVSLSRQRGPGALDTIWAEDGTIFLQTVLTDASPHRWLDAYAGYMHLAPRMIASVSALFPLEWVSIVLSGGAALAIGAVALIVYGATRQHIPHPAGRGALAGSVVVSPSAGIEVANAAANIHWYLPFAISWIVLRTPGGRFDTAVSAAVLFLAATSHPFACLTLPVLGWRIVRAYRLRDAVLAVALLAGLGLQLVVMFSGAGDRPLHTLAASPSMLAQWYGFHVLETAVFGIGMRDALVASVGTPLSAIACLVLLAYLLAPAARATLRQPLLPLTLVSLHAGFYFLPVTLAASSPARYAVTPILLLYGLIVWGLVNDTSRYRKARQIGACVLLALTTVVDFAPRNLRADGPRWSEELSRAHVVCGTQRVASATLPIPPQRRSRGDAPSQWSVTVPCEATTSHQIVTGAPLIRVSSPFSTPDRQ